MSGTGRPSTTAAVVVEGLLVALAPASARAATLLGEAPPTAGHEGICQDGANNSSVVQATSAGNSLLAALSRCATARVARMALFRSYAEALDAVGLSE
jgi:hypothetical protein